MPRFHDLVYALAVRARFRSALTRGLAQPRDGGFTLMRGVSFSGSAAPIHVSTNQQMP